MLRFDEEKINKMAKESIKLVREKYDVSKVNQNIIEILELKNNYESKSYPYYPPQLIYKVNKILKSGKVNYWTEIKEKYLKKNFLNILEINTL